MKLFLLKLLLLQVTATTILSFHVVYATDIQWTSATDGNDSASAAATAPKSQKYWDEHNIERPDYAKTDAEILAEKMSLGGAGGGGIRWMTILQYLFLTSIIVGPIGYFVIWPRILHGKGQTLGTSSSSSSLSLSSFFGGLLFSKPDPTLTRQARLSRFENHDKNDNQEEESFKGSKME